MAMSAARVVPVTLSWIPGGDAGVGATLFVMRNRVNTSLRHPLVTQLAANLRQGTPLGTWQAIRSWLQSHIQFHPDPDGIELVRTPPEQLQIINTQGVFLGDCDDVAVLAATLAKASGFRCRFVVVGFGAPGPATHYSHVYAEALVSGKWLDFDITRRPSSQAPTRRDTLEV